MPVCDFQALSEIHNWAKCSFVVPDVAFEIIITASSETPELHRTYFKIKTEEEGIWEGTIFESVCNKINGEILISAFQVTDLYSKEI